MQELNIDELCACGLRLAIKIWKDREKKTAQPAIPGEISVNDESRRKIIVGKPSRLAVV